MEEFGGRPGDISRRRPKKLRTPGKEKAGHLMVTGPILSVVRPA